MQFFRFEIFVVKNFAGFGGIEVNSTTKILNFVKKLVYFYQRALKCRVGGFCRVIL